MSSSINDGDFLNTYVIHAYKSPFHAESSDVIMWDFVGRRVEAVVKPLKTYPTSCFLSSADLRLKEQVLVDLKAVSSAWFYHNGREDKTADTHTDAYLATKAQVEELSAIVLVALKTYFGFVAK